MAFKIAGSIGFKAAIEKAQPVLLEPIMHVEITVPEESVGDIIGDMNSRRGRVLGTNPRGHYSAISVEAPLAEMLSYAPDLTSMTGGRGDYTMEFLRYEEVPAHMTPKSSSSPKEREEAPRARVRAQRGGPPRAVRPPSRPVRHRPRHKFSCHLLRFLGTTVAADGAVESDSSNYGGSPCPG